MGAAIRLQQQAITVNEWCAAGLTRNMFEHDSKQGKLQIIERGINGNTLIDISSIKRPDRLRKIEQYLGCTLVEMKPKYSIYNIEIDEQARNFYIECKTPDGDPLLTPDKISEYTYRASIFNAIKNGLHTQLVARQNGNRLKMGEFWSQRLKWYQGVAIEYNVQQYSSERGLKEAYNKYFAKGKPDYESIIHKGFCGDTARKVSEKIEKLLLALWISNNKPFKNEVHQLYMDFVRGGKEFFDRETGEVFLPEDYRYIPTRGDRTPRPLEISISTVWNYLKKHLNDAATAGKRDGNYIAVVEKRPFVFRSSPNCSLSKISMDDADLSRKMKGGTRVHRYMIFDVASGYWFTPVYSRNSLTQEDVIQAFRNMFCELELIGLPMPGEVEHEHHLLDGIMSQEEFRALFPFVTVSSHSRGKRAEHGIKALKWGVAHKNNHTRGRFYGKGCYRTPRFRAKGEFSEKEYEYGQIVTDDLNDIAEHNATLHPNQETYPGMTREQVFLQNVNRNLPALEPYYLYKFIGNETATTIRNNNHLQCNNELFLLDDFKTLKRLKSGDPEVLAYWIPAADGSVKQIYLYQNDKYMGSATNVNEYRFNESKFEETELDRENRLKQDKRIAKFDKMTREIRSEMPKVGIMKADTMRSIVAEPVEILPTINIISTNSIGDFSEQEYCEDFAEMALNDF